MATVQCRFCLEPTRSMNNPFIDPCECRGSVRYIHEKCLKRWIELDPAKNGSNCTICGTPFKNISIPLIEDIPELKHKGFKFAIEMISAIGTTGQIFIFGLIPSSDPLFRNLSFLSLGLVHEIYVISFVRNTQIRNRIAYIKEAGKNGFILLWMAHLFFFYLMAYEDYFSVSFGCYLLLDSYWAFHIRTLREINNEILNRPLVEDY